MADYGYGAALGHVYQSAGDDIAKGITAAHKQAMKQHQDAEGVQALLDIAHRFNIPDPKTGKPVPVLKEEHYQYIKGLIDNKKYHAAGQAEAAFGITKDMIPRWQAAAAKQAAAYQQAQETARMQQQSLGGPYQMTDAQGNKYRGNMNDKGIIQWYPDTAVPKNQMGLNAKEQFDMQRGMVKDANAAQSAQFKAEQQATVARNKAFSGLLKGVGIQSPTDLFDPTIQQGGVADPQTGFTQTDPSQGPQSHIRLYHQPPSSPDAKDGKLGIVLPTTDVVKLQDQAASMAGPQAVQALQWLRQNPSNEHAAAVRDEIIKRTGEATKAPDPATFTPTQPSFAPPSAPAQPYPQQQQPVDDTSQVSQEAADQNPGY